LIGFGYNAGLKLRIISKEVTKHTNIFFMGMYGYNAVINVKDAEEFNKMYYGPTFGVGIDVKPNLRKSNYYSFVISVPIRDPEVKSQMHTLEHYHGISFNNGLWPIAVSITHRIGFTDHD
jgi:hypothetical protein